MLLLLACTDPQSLPVTARPAPGIPAPPGAPGAMPGPSAMPGSGGAGAQAARAAPVTEAPWEGPWTVRLFAEPGVSPGAGLGLIPQAWQGGRPPTGPGEAAVIWLGAEFPLPGLLQRLDGPGRGAVVVALGAPGAAWREQAASALPWRGAGVVDPYASLSLWADPQGASMELLGLVAARVIADHYHAPFHPQPGPWPPLAAVWLSEVPLSADPAIRAEQARRGGPEVEAAAEAMAAEADAAVRLGIANSTGRQDLLYKLSSDPEPMVRARAADRLDDLERLRAMLADPSSLVRVVAAHRLLQARDSAGLAAAARSPDAYVRWKAASGVVEPLLLVDLLSDVDIDVRRAAALQAGRLPAIPAPLQAALIRGSADSNSFVRRWCMEALGKVRTPEAKAALYKGIADPTLLVAAAAAKSLAAHGEPRQAPPFTPQGPPADAAERDRRAQSPDATTRKDLCKFLADQADGGRWLLPLAQDQDSEVRKSAVEALGWRAAQEATFVAALHAALSDPDPDVRITALEGLRRSGSGRAADLLPLLRQADAEIRLRAAEALAATAAPPAELQSFYNDPDERLRAAVGRAFPGAIRADDPSLLVRWTALLASGALPAAEQFRLRGILAREDDLLHERFSWNSAEDRPAAYRSLRPPVIREYGHPDRG